MSLLNAIKKGLYRLSNHALEQAPSCARVLGVHSPRPCFRLLRLTCNNDEEFVEVLKGREGGGRGDCALDDLKLDIRITEWAPYLYLDAVSGCMRACLPGGRMVKFFFFFYYF